MSFFWSASYKDQHPAKKATAVENADMTMNQKQFLGIFDGVSGVVDMGLKAEDMSWDLREQCRSLLFLRSEQNTNRTLFDKQLRQDINLARGSADAPGAWLQRLMISAVQNTTLLGATTASVVSLFKGKLAYYHLGDGVIRVYRRSGHTTNLREVFASRALASTIRLRTGQEILCPKQVSIGIDALRGSAAHGNINEGDYGTFNVLPGDIVLLASDGVADNIADHTLRNLVSTASAAGKTPFEFTRIIVEHSIRANIKPDDVCVVIGIVQ